MTDTIELLQEACFQEMRADELKIGKDLRPRVALPPNITPIDSQADLYGYGVVSLGFLEVADELDAVKRAEGRKAFLLKSNTRPVWYLIFPHVIVEPHHGDVLEVREG
jgi:hypothetical protein